MTDVLDYANATEDWHAYSAEVLHEGQVQPLMNQYRLDEQKIQALHNVTEEAWQRVWDWLMT